MATCMKASTVEYVQMLQPVPKELGLQVMQPHPLAKNLWLKLIRFEQD